MSKQPLQDRSSTSDDRLRRSNEQPDCTGQLRELPLENLIVIGASAGGHKALWEVIRELSHDIPAAVVIMQHMAPTNPRFESYKLDAWLRGASRVRVIEIRAGERLRSGIIYICPPGMSVFLKGRTLHLKPQDREPPVYTINALFESAAMEFRDRVIGVILTGLLKDGTAGLKAVHDSGGVTIVQDPTNAEYPDMPANAMKDLPVTFCLKIAEIGPTLDLLARRRAELETGFGLAVRTLKERVTLLLRLIAQSKRNPETYQFLSTEMSALELELRAIQTLLDKASGSGGKTA